MRSKHAGRTGPDQDEGRYRNPPGTRHAEYNPDGFTRFLWRRMLDRGAPGVPPGHVWSADEVQAGLMRFADTDCLTWLGHAAFIIRLAGCNILTDPFLSDVAAPWPLRSPRRYVPPALSVGQLPGIDLLLVSHSHYDHLDEPTIRALAKRPELPAVVVPAGLGQFFRRRGFSRVSELSWWQSIEIDALRVTAVPAIHFSRRGAFDHNTALWCGFVVEAPDGRRCYFAGDTAYAPLLREIGEAFGQIDMALVPIGAYAPRHLMASVHVCPEEAADLCRDVGARRAVAMHWGTIVLTDEPPFEPPVRWRAAMQSRGYDDAAIGVLAVGETRPLD